MGKTSRSQRQTDKRKKLTKETKNRETERKIKGEKLRGGTSKSQDQSRIENDGDNE